MKHLSKSYFGGTASAYITLADAATVATDAGLGNFFTVTLGANRILGNPTNPADGQIITWQIKQDATGGRTLALDTKFRVTSPIVLSAAANAIDMLVAVYNASDDKYDVIGFVRSGKLWQDYNFYNVRDYGNDIQATVDAAEAAGGGTVFIPDGTYNNTALTVSGNVRLLGASNSKTILTSTSNSVIVDCTPVNFEMPQIENLRITGSVSAGSGQIGLRFDDATYGLRAVVKNVWIEDCGGNGLYIGKTFSSLFENVFIDNCEGYPLLYNAQNMPGNVFNSIYVGTLRAAAPTAYRIKAGTFIANDCNGINNSVSGSRWAVIGKKNGVDGDTGNAGAVAIFRDCNIESFELEGIRLYHACVLSLLGRTSLAGAGTNANQVAIFFEHINNGTDYYDFYLPKGYIEDTVDFADGLAVYSQSQPIHSNGFPNIQIMGVGPATGGNAQLSTYYHTGDAAVRKLPTSGSNLHMQNVSASTTFTEPGIRWINVDSSGGAVTVTLPWAGKYGRSQDMIVINDGGGAAATNNITITALSGSTVNGATHVISKNYGSAILIPDPTASDYRLISQHLEDTVTGTGSSTRIAHWSSADTLTSTSGFTWASSQLTIPGVVIANNGSAGAPAYTFAGSNSSGLFWENSVSEIRFATAGGFRARLGATDFATALNVIPETADTYDLGLSGLEWRTGYFGTSVVIGRGSTETGLLSLRHINNGNLSTIQSAGQAADITLTLPNVTDTIAGIAATQTLTNKTIGSGTTVTSSITWGTGVRQTFTPDATNAGLNVGSFAGDPSSPSNGDLWYDSTANELTARINGANVALGAGGGGITTLNTLTATTQTFAKVDDTNVTLSIGSATSTHTFTLGWTGTLDKSRQNAATVYTDASNSWADGVKQTFNPNATNAGINVGTHAGDPSSLANGDIWYSTSTQTFRARQNSATLDLIARANGSTAGLLQYNDGSGNFSASANDAFLYDDGTTTLSIGYASSAGKIALTHSSLDVTTIVPADNTGSLTLTLPAAGTNLVSDTATQTLTNKTLTAPVISTISNSGTVTIPTGTVTLATLTGTETFTNKTLTSPRIGTSILDTNGNELFTVTATASAVNELSVVNGATGTGPTLTVSGGDTNADLNLDAKGTGVIRAKQAIVSDINTVTYAATITPDASLSNRIRVTLTGNITINGPSNPKDGQQITIELIQDATGSRTVTLATGAGNFKFGTDITGITASTAASTTDILTAYYNSTANRWYVIGFVKGY